MRVFRDRETGEAVTWCSDPEVAAVISGGAERLVRMPDIGANMYYRNHPDAERQGFNWVHPYDQARIDMLQAELAVLTAWHRAGGNW